MRLSHFYHLKPSHVHYNICHIEDTLTKTCCLLDCTFYWCHWKLIELTEKTCFQAFLVAKKFIFKNCIFSGESFKAHRLVLAACSAHFSKLFSNSTLNGQLIVILEGTHHQDLQILLQFMYKGVAYLHQDRIESVLRTAEVLQVKHTIPN